jgi:uncharacterized protein
MRVFSLLTLLFVYAVARADFQVPPLTGPVVDEAGVISESTSRRLDQFLRSFFERGGAQIQIATVRDLGGLSIEEASIKVTDQWKLGKKKESRGVLLLLAPNEHKVRIEVGQGLEGNLPDITASRIVREVIIPRLREGSTDRALIDGVLAIMQYTDPQLIAETSGGMPIHSHSAVFSNSLGESLVWFFVLTLILMALFTNSRRRRGFWGGGGYWGGGGGWGGGGWGGGGGFGGGGGWSGGGGGFSGGGASGSW